MAQSKGHALMHGIATGLIVIWLVSLLICAFIFWPLLKARKRHDASTVTVFAPSE
jgi:cbb3-type cytochrome oxidase subunit 3